MAEQQRTKQDFDPATDLRLHRGGHFGVRLVELDEERSAWIPEGFVVQVAPDATPETRKALIRTDIDAKEDGITYRYDHFGNRSFDTGRQVFIEVETTEDGDMEIRSVTVKHLDRPIQTKDVTEGLRIRGWAEEGLRRATGYLSTRIETGVISDETWEPGFLLGDEVVDRVRQRAPSRRGRKKDEQALAFTAECYLAGKNPAEIRIELRRQLKIDRSERTIRRWLTDIKDQGGEK
jgi:hypothetical protein